MKEHELTSAVLSAVNDSIVVTAYGHGYLVVLPYSYYDEDRVTVFVEPFEQGVRVTDRGLTAVRLQSSELNLDTPRVRDAWFRSITSAELFNPANEEFEIAHWGDEKDLGESMLKVAEASLRVDQLRWLYSDRQPRRFTDRVVGTLRNSVRSPEEVLTPANVLLRSGRARRVTASVGLAKPRRVFVQAVGSGSPENRERAIEHCYHTFNLAQGVPKERRLAFADGSRKNWQKYAISELEEVCTVAFIDEDDSWLRGYLSRETQEESLT